MKLIQSVIDISPKTLARGLLIAIVIGVYGSTTVSAPAQANARAIDSMYTCIDANTKRAEARAANPRGEEKFRSALRTKTLEAVKDRKELLQGKKFSDATLEQRYQKIDKIIASGNQALKGNKVDKPSYHLGKIKAERDNLIAQLETKAQIARDNNTSTEQLIANHCETSWGLRVFAAAGRKWQGQANNDTLSARNAVAKAYWVAAKKPKGKDPSQFDRQIAQFQKDLDELVIPRTGVVGTSTLNPKDGEIKEAFAKHLIQPQKQLRKEIADNNQQIKKLMAPKAIKPTGKNKHGYVQLPTNNDLYYIYGSEKANTGDGGTTPAYQRYGKPALVSMFQNVAIKFNEKYPETKLVVGDLNAIAGHASHKNGLDIDVYGQNRMAADMRGKNRNAKSVERTITLGKLFMDTKKIDVIFYNDPVVIRQVNAYAKKNNLPGHMEASNSSHEFHFHVRMKGKSGPYDSCAQAGADKNCFR